MKKSFYFLSFIIFVSGTTTSFCMAAEPAALRRLLPHDYSYYGICSCGQIINKIDRAFGNHRYCGVVAAPPLPQQQQHVDVPVADAKNHTAESSSSPSTSTASTNQQSNPPNIIHITGSTKNDGAFSGRVLCPFHKQCAFIKNIQAPSSQNVFTVAEPIIRKHLREVHAITNLQFDS